MNKCFKKSKTLSPEKSQPVSSRFQTVPGEILKKYVIESELGRGAFGNVSRSCKEIT